ncbi:MAG TPA: hypothetical protein VHE10_00085 [Candidatus Paceibacterota bacterium]|nr:hypothetical protein [Candidatus Paceibacterota bacterium]
MQNVEPTIQTIIGLFCTLIAGILLGAAISSHIEWEIVASLSHAFIAISAVIGLSQVFMTHKDIAQRKARETIEMAMSQIRFYREVVIGTSNDLEVALRTGGRTLICNITPKTAYDFSVEGFAALRSDTAFMSAYEHYRKERSVYREVASHQLELLNALEEFSINVITYNLRDIAAMESIKNLMVETIEENAFALFAFVNQGDNFSYLNELYRAWKRPVQFS